MNEMVEIFFGAMIVGFSGALVPGPMLTLVISSVAGKGFWTSFFLVVGHAILELLIVAAFFLGLLRYLEDPLVAKIIGTLGGVFLLYLGVDILISVFRKRFTIDFKAEPCIFCIEVKIDLLFNEKILLIPIIHIPFLSDTFV